MVENLKLAPQVEGENAFEKAGAETVQTYRYPYFTEETKEKMLMFEDSLESAFEESPEEPIKQEENVVGSDDNDALGDKQIVYFELFSDTLDYSNPSTLLTAFRANPHK